MYSCTLEKRFGKYRGPPQKQAAVTVYEIDDEKVTEMVNKFPCIAHEDQLRYYERKQNSAI